MGNFPDVLLKNKVALLQKLISKVKKSFNQRLKRERQRKEHESIHLSYSNYEKLRLLSKFYKTTPKAFLNNMIKQIHNDQITLHQDFLGKGDRYPIDVKGFYDLKNKPKHPEPKPSSLLQRYSAKYNKQSNAESSTDSGTIESVSSEHTPETLAASDSGISDHLIEQTNSTNEILAESVTGDGLANTNAEVLAESVYRDDVSENTGEVAVESVTSHGLFENTGEAVPESVNSNGLTEGTDEAVTDLVNSDDLTEGTDEAVTELVNSDGAFETTGDVEAGFTNSDCQPLPSGTVEMSPAPTHSQVLSLTHRTNGPTFKNS